jgi:hypothetical protein
VSDIGNGSNSGDSKPNGEVKRKPGAQPGNMNAFTTGSTIVVNKRRPKRLRLAGRSRRRSVYEEFCSDLGGEDNMTKTLRAVAWEAAHDNAVLWQMTKAIDEVMLSAQAKLGDLPNPGVLAKLDALRRPIAESYVRKLVLLGFERKARTIPWEESLREIEEEVPRTQNGESPVDEAGGAQDNNGNEENS